MQSQRFDPDGGFIRRYLPELARVPDAHIHFPAAMKPAVSGRLRLAPGRGLPLPVVDHARARQRTLMRFRFFESEISRRPCGKLWNYVTFVTFGGC